MKNGESQREAGRRRRRDGGVERGRGYERERERGEGSDVYLQGGFLKAPMLHQPAHSIDSTGFFAFCLLGGGSSLLQSGGSQFQVRGRSAQFVFVEKGQSFVGFFFKNLLQRGVWHQSEK